MAGLEHLHIFEAEEEYPCMLVDMRPARVQPRVLDERSRDLARGTERAQEPYGIEAV